LYVHLVPSPIESMEWHQLRSVSTGIKTAEIPGIGKVAICNSIAAAQHMLETETWRDEYLAIEVMACVDGGSEPNSIEAHTLLHTSYAARNSTRLLLMQFLDCVDRRDGHAAVKLFHPDAIWSTASPFGDRQGTVNIEALINTRLPPRKYGPGYARHRMESTADVDDFSVITPAGERCRFSIEVETRMKGVSPGW